MQFIPLSANHISRHITRARYSVAFDYKAKKLPQNVWNIKEWKP